MKKDSAYLHHILDAIGKIGKYAEVGEERFIADILIYPGEAKQASETY